MTRITAAMRQELVRLMRERYRTATRDERVRILDELVHLSGYHRKHAITVLNAPDCTDARGDQGVTRGRPRLYGDAVRGALTILWETSDRVCGKRLKALLPILVPALERHGHLELDTEVRVRLLSASAASIDRVLRAARTTTPRRRKRLATKLRKSIPVRTFAEWNDPPPGSMEADLVAHCGDTAVGSYVHTLTLTDITSGWTECIPLVVREGTLVKLAIEGVRPMLPFPLRALDTDNVLTAESSRATDIKAPGERRWRAAQFHLPQWITAPNGLPRRGDPRSPSLTQGPPPSDGLHRT